MYHAVGMVNISVNFEFDSAGLPGGPGRYM